MNETPSITSAVFIVLGGLALFLLGMRIMTEGLRLAAGSRIRHILLLATKNRWGAYGLGSGLGFLMHSSAASVMTVGFVNAGLLTLLGALPVLYGLNLGTTLSMQLLSFRLTELAYVFLFVGFAVQLAVPSGIVHQAGRALMGFGLLFLGMDVMGDVLGHFREDLAPYLTAIDGGSLRGLLVGILVAAAVTGILQSSGAVIGMAFVLLEAGMLTSLEQAYPIILGAHIGTSVTALLASIGTGIEARRTAVANLSFNLFNVLLGILFAPLIIGAIEMTANDPVHQAANAHTAVMLVAGLVLIPLAARHEWLIRKITPSRKPVPSFSFLDTALLAKPESAIRATVLELNRSLRICGTSMEAVAKLQRGRDRGLLKQAALNEAVIDEIKEAVEDYLESMTRRYLSRRQALMVQYLSRTNANIERIGDHIASLAEVVEKRAQRKETPLDEKAVESILELIAKADGVLSVLRDALRPDAGDFAKASEPVLARRDDFTKAAEEAEERFNRRVAEHKEKPLAGLYYTETLLALSRLVRHCKVIAQEMRQPFFAIKERKFDRTVPENKP